MIVVGSLVAAVAPSAGALIAARALQGIGGAITTYLGWRWIFWVNVHLGLLVLFGIWKLAPQTTTEHKEHGTDVFGVLLSAIGFGLLVFVLIEGPTWGRLTPKSAAVIGPFTWSANAAFSLIPARGGVLVIWGGRREVWDIDRRHGRHTRNARHLEFGGLRLDRIHRHGAVLTFICGRTWGVIRSGAHAEDRDAQAENNHGEKEMHPDVKGPLQVAHNTGRTPALCRGFQFP